MSRCLAIGLFLIAAAATAQPAEEDAAHRADRARVEQLNRDAGRVVRRRNDGNEAAQQDYRAARADYEQDMAEWRRRVAACRDGVWSACQ